MAEASWGDCSAHSSPHGSCGSPTDLLPRPRHRGADTPSTLRRHSLSRKAAVWHLFFGTDVCRASTCLIWGYFSTVPAGLSRDEFVKYRPDSGEKLVPIAIGTVAIPFLGWYNMENVENCRIKGIDKLGICPQGGQPSRAQDMCSRFCPTPLGIVLWYGKLEFGGFAELTIDN